MNIPPDVVRPLRQRLEVLRAEQRGAPQDHRLASAIIETEALIKQLENPNAPRSA